MESADVIEENNLKETLQYTKNVFKFQNGSIAGTNMKKIYNS